MPLNNYITNVPGVTVNIIPPVPVLNGVPTNLIGFVGTAAWGPKNSPTRVGNMQDMLALFSTPQPQQYDLGTCVYVGTLNSANNFICVRVTDGTDTAAVADILDSAMSPAIGAVLTSIYTGSGGNQTFAILSTGSGSTPSAPTYRITIFMTGGIPEVFDAIGGSGIVFWQNLVSAINNGQSVARGRSQLVIASLFTGISSVTVTAPGSYTTAPTATASIGTGATLVPHLSLLNSTTLAGGGTGYTAGDVLTLVGGTSGTAAQITVDTVTGGVVTTFHVSRAGDYTALPTSPIAVTGGSGTGATFTGEFGLLSIAVTAPGTGYTNSTVISISGSGGGTATAHVGSTASPLLDSQYQLSGGTDGNSGVTTETLVGSDTEPRTGMYALRGSNASMVALVDGDDPTYFTNQVSFGQQEGAYMIGTIAPGYQDNPSGAITIKQNAGIDSYTFKLMTGDWVEINDTFNGQTRFISPQSFVCAILATEPPYLSSLNVPMNGVVATQKTAENRIYSDANLSQLATGNLDVITRPIPASNSAFGVRLGINTSSNLLASTDNYTRMNNYIALTVLAGMGIFIGNAYNDTTVNKVQNTISAFLQVLAQQGWIGVLTTNQNTAPPPAFSVSMDTSKQTAGILIANVNVYLFNILSQLVINLNANSGQQSITILPPQLVR